MHGKVNSKLSNIGYFNNVVINALSFVNVVFNALCAILFYCETLRGYLTVKSYIQIKFSYLITDLLTIICLLKKIFKLLIELKKV